MLKTSKKLKLILKVILIIGLILILLIPFLYYWYIKNQNWVKYEIEWLYSIEIISSQEDIFSFIFPVPLNYSYPSEWLQTLHVSSGQGIFRIIKVNESYGLQILAFKDVRVKADYEYTIITERKEKANLCPTCGDIRTSDINMSFMRFFEEVIRIDNEFTAINNSNPLNNTIGYMEIFCECRNSNVHLKLEYSRTVHIILPPGNTPAYYFTKSGWYVDTTLQNGHHKYPFEFKP